MADQSPNPTIPLALTCALCGTTFQPMVPVMGYVLWAAGCSNRIAFPNLTAEERGLLESGACGACWDGMLDAARSTGKMVQA